MIKKLSLICLATSILCAGYLEEYNNKNYKKALELAKAQCDIDCNSEELNIILAKSAEKLKDTKEAIAAYDRVLIVNENNIEARFSIANLYYENGNPELMKDELNYMLNNLDLSQEQKTRINNLLSNLEKTKEISRPYFLGINVGFGYDSNPLYGNDKYTDFVNKEMENFQNQKSNGSTSIIFSIDGSYNLDLGNNYSTQFYGNFYNKKYLKNKSENYPDLNVLSLGINPKYTYNNHKFVLNLGYDFVMLRRAAFLHSINLGFTYENNLNDNYLYSIFYDYSKGIFDNSYDKDSNFNHHSLGFNNVLAYNNNIYYLNLNYDFEKAKESLSSNSDFKSYGVKIGAIIPFATSYAFKPSISYTHTNYSKEDISYFSKRKDNEYFVSATIEYMINSNQTISLNLSYDKDDSNHNFYDSINYTTMLNYRYEF